MGAMHGDGKLKITEDIVTDLVYTRISWVRDQDVKPSGKQVRGYQVIPLYQGATRFTVFIRLNL